MKVYAYDPAPNPQRLALFMKMKGLELETIPVDMTTGEHLGDAYKQINPAGTLPALVLDDGTVLTEVVGMYTYLEDLHPEPPLMGQTPLERGQVMSWCHKLFTGLTQAVASVFRNRSKGFVNRALPGPQDLPQIPDLAERGRMQINFAMPMLDEHLATSRWLAGDNFTAADIDLYVTIGFMGWRKESIPENCTHLNDWFRRAQEKLS